MTLHLSLTRHAFHECMNGLIDLNKRFCSLLEELEPCPFSRELNLEQLLDGLNMKYH